MCTNSYIYIYQYFLSHFYLHASFCHWLFLWSLSDHYPPFEWCLAFSKHKGFSAKISVCIPRFCTVYAVSKGKLFIRPSDMQIVGSIIDDTSETSFSSSSSSNYTSTTQTGTILWLKKQDLHTVWYKTICLVGRMEFSITITITI